MTPDSPASSGSAAEAARPPLSRGAALAHAIIALRPLWLAEIDLGELLYLADGIACARLGRTITGIEWRRGAWPKAAAFNEAMADLRARGLVTSAPTEHQMAALRLVSLAPPAPDALAPDEHAIAEYVVKRWASGDNPWHPTLGARRAIEGTTPWLAARPGACGREGEVMDMRLIAGKKT